MRLITDPINQRGTIAIARTSNPYSTANQFFINAVDNVFLDHTGKTPQGWGIAFSGKLLKGLKWW